MWLNRNLLDFRHFVLRFEDLIGFFESFFHITDINADFCGQIFFRIRIGEVHIFRFVMDSNRTRTHRLPRIENRIQHFILDLDQAESFFCNLRCLCRDERHAVADEADFVVQRKRIQRPRYRIGLPGRRVHHARDVLPGQHRSHAFQRACLARVDLLDARMGMR